MTVMTVTGRLLPGAVKNVCRLRALDADYGFAADVSVEARRSPVLGWEFHAAFKCVADCAFVTANLILVTNDDCHLCVRAHELLARIGVEPYVINVDSTEAAALAAAGIALAFLPVLTDGRRVIAYGRFSEKRLEKELAL